METNSTVAVYQSHEHATGDVALLRQVGIDVTKISIIGKDYHTNEHVTGNHNTGDRMKYSGKLGPLRGGSWGLLLHSGNRTGAGRRASGCIHQAGLKVPRWCRLTVAPLWQISPAIAREVSDGVAFHALRVDV